MDDDTLDRFRDDLAADGLDYLADPLAATVKRVVEQVAPKTVAETTAPLRQFQDAALRQADEKATAETFDALTAAHPDWRDHEDAMLALAEKLSPNGLSETEYLDRLYQLATREKWEAGREKQIAARVSERVAEHAREARASTPATLAECFRAAKRGERWD